MQLPSALQTLKDTIPLFIYGTIKNKNFLPTKGVIYKMLKTKHQNEEHLFNNNDWRSAFGTARSLLSQVCKNKENRSLPNIFSFNYEGVDYFYTNIEELHRLAVKNTSDEVIENVDKKETRKHVNIQYQLCSIFTKIGCKVWVPKNDSNGEKNRTKYNDKTISESFNENMVSLNTNDPFYWVDFIVYNNDSAIIQLEVEESTEVLKGLERMYTAKKAYGKINSIVTSTKPNYLKKFEEYASGTYENLGATFMDPQKIEKLYEKSLKVCENDEKFKKLVFKEFGL
jgi:hypothetical protein